jgi:hypothetical protein
VSTERLDLVHEHHALDFCGDAIAGFVRLARVDERCWYWCYLVGDDLGLVAVRDHDVMPPRRPDVLEIRADALWAELVCETPGEHWSIGLEAFGVHLDTALEAWTSEIGERVAVGLDLEWEVDELRPPGGVVHGDVLLERDRFAFDGHGVLTHAVGPATAWPTDWHGWCRFDDGRWSTVIGGAGRRGDDGISVPAEVQLDDGTTARCDARAVVPVPLGTGPASSAGRGPALVRVWTGVALAGMTGTGWVEVLQS